MLRILGIRVDEYDMRQSLEKIGALLTLQQADMPLQQVVTINPEGIWLAQNDAEFRQIIDKAALVTADGSGVLWAAAQLGQHLPERVTGIDLLQQLCARAAEQGWRQFLLGAEPGVAEQAAQALQQRYPGLIVAGTENGFFAGREQQVVEKIAASGADILFVGLGMPLQEKWIYQHGSTLNCKLAIGVGGSFDVLAGKVKRAPRTWQKLRMEWLWRLLQDPKRWRRYLVIPKYMLAVKKQARKQKKLTKAD